MEEKLAVGNHPVLYDQSLFTYRDTNWRSQAWREVAETVVGFRLFGEFISILLRAFLLRMSGAGDSCDWLLVALLAKNPQASDPPTSKIFLTLLCGRSVIGAVKHSSRAGPWHWRTRRSPRAPDLEGRCVGRKKIIIIKKKN